jgi:serine/threonine protein kinase
MTSITVSWEGRSLCGGRYRLMSKLGEGGMGVVYRGEDFHLGTEVVVKIPRRSVLEDDPESLRRFRQEIRSLVHLEHPHIVKIIDVGEQEGIPFAVMQYLRGGSLESRGPRGQDQCPKSLPPAELGRWLLDVSEALDFIHAQGYVHRDIKPANILFDHHGHVFLSDFGIVKGLTAATQQGCSVALTGSGMVLGTPQYMAPEVILGEPYDGRADQYSLAVVVYELLAGVCPFEAPTPMAILLRQANEPAPHLQSLCASVPKDLGDVVSQALSKKAPQRFKSCQSFAEAVLELTQYASSTTSRASRLRKPKVSEASVVDTGPSAGIPTPSASIVQTRQPLCERIGPTMKTAGHAVLMAVPLLLKWLDRLMRKATGKENTILHTFLRVLALPVLLAGLSTRAYLVENPASTTTDGRLSSDSHQRPVPHSSDSSQANGTLGDSGSQPAVSNFTASVAPPGELLDDLNFNPSNSDDSSEIGHRDCEMRDPLLPEAPAQDSTPTPIDTSVPLRDAQDLNYHSYQVKFEFLNPDIPTRQLTLDELVQYVKTSPILETKPDFVNGRWVSGYDLRGNELISKLLVLSSYVNHGKTIREIDFLRERDRLISEFSPDNGIGERTLTRIGAQRRKLQELEAQILNN